MATGLQRWYPAPDIFTIGDGAQLYIHQLVGGCCETTVEMVRGKLAGGQASQIVFQKYETNRIGGNYDNRMGYHRSR